MKITAIESFLLKIPYDNGGKPWNLTGKPWATLDILMLRIDTDEGVSGWGEAFGHAIIEGTKVTLDQMVAPVLIGRDPREIGAIFHELRQKFHLFGYNGPALFALRLDPIIRRDEN